MAQEEMQKEFALIEESWDWSFLKHCNSRGIGKELQNGGLGSSKISSLTSQTKQNK